MRPTLGSKRVRERVFPFNTCSILHERRGSVQGLVAGGIDTLLPLNTLLNSMLFNSLSLISLSRNRICGHNYIMCDIELLPD